MNKMNEIKNFLFSGKINIKTKELKLWLELENLKTINSLLIYALDYKRNTEKLKNIAKKIIDIIKNRKVTKKIYFLDSIDFINIKDNELCKVILIGRNKKPI